MILINRIILGLLLLSAPLATAYAAPEKLIVESPGGAHHYFSIEIADQPDELEKGLMHRKDMPRNHGMLFLFESDMPVSMWMKDTPMSLDMLFIDSKGVIVYIAHKTTPGSLEKISAKKPVRGVLELKGGTAELRGITAGDRIIHTYFTP